MADKEETKRSKFVQLANARGVVACERIALISKLANLTNYEFTKDDASAIVGELRSEVDKVEKAFAGALSGNPVKTEEARVIIAA